MLLSEDNFGPVKTAETPDFKLHELCTLWSQANDSDLDEMIKVTRTIGGIFNEPATVWNGLMLDGRNRQIVCRTLGIPLYYREFNGTYEQARAFVIAKNAARRHLTKDQQTMYLVEQARVDARNGFGKGPDDEAISKKVGTTRKKVYQAKLIAEMCEQEDDEESNRVKRIMSGESTIADELKAIREEGRGLNLEGPEIKDKKRIYDEAEDSYQDSAGYPIPGRLRDIWDAVPQFSLLRGFTGKLLEELKRLIQHPAASKLSVEHIANVKSLMRDLDGKQPNFVCPHCIGTRKCQCQLCSTRWSGRGMEECDKCYCCQGDGYLIKEMPYPDQEWYNYQRSGP